MSATAMRSVAEVTDDSYRDLMRHAGRHRLLRPHEEIRLAKRIERGDLVAKDLFVKHNYRLVGGIIVTYQGNGLSRGELFNEGIVGLIRAVEKFDWRRGLKFSTYATQWIHQAIRRAIENTGRAIRVPVHQAQAIRRMTRVERELASQLLRPPTVHELAEHLEKSEEEIWLMKEASLDLVSLDVTIGDAEDTAVTFVDAVVDTRPSPFEETIEHPRAARLRQMVAELPAQEAFVLAHYFGLTSAGETTLKSISIKFGVAPQRISQLRDKGLQQLLHLHGAELSTLFDCGPAAPEEPNHLMVSPEQPILQPVPT